MNVLILDHKTVVAEASEAHQLEQLDSLGFEVLPLAFRDAYRAALETWLERSGPIQFPEGTYKMQTYPGVISERSPPRRYQAA